jgi:hypothetical protein
MKNNKNLILSALFILSFSVANLFGQSKYCKGTVKDANNAVIIGANVSIKNKQSKIIERAVSDF